MERGETAQNGYTFKRNSSAAANSSRPILTRYNNNSLFRRFGRCGIKLYEPSPGDSGWDVFSLDYHVESPLSAVVHAGASSKYRKVFHLLWRLKRIEWGLNNTWRRATSVNHSLRASSGASGSITKALRKVALARQEMLHVTSNIQNYLMFEVLEGSWNGLRSDLDGSESLDDVVSAHDRYLSNILRLAMLGDDAESRRLAAQLALVFDVADRFCAVQDRVFVDCLAALGGEARRVERAQGRIQKGEWGYDGDSSFLDGASQAVELLGLSSLEGVASTTAEFEEGLKRLLELLVNRLDEGEGHDALRFLTFRLDFNNYYEKKHGELV